MFISDFDTKLCCSFEMQANGVPLTPFCKQLRDVDGQSIWTKLLDKMNKYKKDS